MKIKNYIQPIHKCFAATVIAFCCLIAFNRAEAQVNLTNGLWAYYGFNDGTASNNLVNGPIGTFVGTPTVTNGVFQNALSFNGVSDSVTTASGFYFSHITVCAYVMLAAPLAAGSEQDFLNQYPDPVKEGFALGIIETNGVNLFVAKFHPRHEQWGTCAFYPEIKVVSLSPVIPGKYYHVALTYDYEGNLILYINGVKEAQKNTDGSNYYSCSWITPSLTIGSRNHVDEFFNGIIDEVYIYSRALSLAEIMQIQYPPLAPYITQQPVGVTAAIGSNAPFSVSALSASALPLFYQWQRNGTNLVANTNLMGVTSSFLSISNIQTTNLGFYSVVITNIAGSVTSSCVLLGITNTLDTDQDGIPDWWESLFGLDTNNASDANLHPPGDQLTYLQKYLYGLDPLTIDTDGDGLSDYDELFVYGINPQKADTEGDGIPDGWEIQHDLNPLNNDATNQAGVTGVTYLQIYQYNLTHTNQLDPSNPFPQAGKSIYEIINSGAHTNRVYYDKNDRLVGEEFSTGIAIAYTYDGNGNIVRQTVLSRASETNGLPVLWQFLNGLTNGTAASGPNGDPDGDGYSNYQEWLAGTSPTNSQSRPNQLGPVGNTIATLTLPFAVSNFVSGVGQLDGSGAEEIVVGGDGNPGSTTNSIYIFTENSAGWTTQKVNIGSFGVTSLAIGQPANRPAPAIYAGLRQTGGKGRVMELMNVGGLWQTNILAFSTNAAAYVLGVRTNQDVLVSLATTNGPDGALFSVGFSTNWNLTLMDTNTSHRSLGTVARPEEAQFLNGALRLLDTGGISAGTTQGGALSIPNLVSYWKLDESSGNAANSVESNTLINNNDVVYDPGKINNAADFGSANTSKYLSTGANLGISATTSCSYSLWVKMNSEINSDIQGFASLLFQNGVYLIIQYQYNGGSRRLNFYYGRGGVGNFSNNYLTTLGTSNWHHLVFTYNGSTGEVLGYLDGSNIVDFTNNGTINNTSIFQNLFSIGSGWDSGSVDHFANCKIDEVGVWSRALSPAEVSSLYSTSSLFPEPSATNRLLWRGTSLAVGTPRLAFNSGASLFYAFIDNVANNGQISSGDNFVLSEFLPSNTNITFLDTNTFFDNFPRASLNTTYWTNIVGNIVVSSGKVVLTGANTSTSMSTAGHFNMTPGSTLVFSNANIPSTTLSYPNLGTGSPKFQVGWNQGQTIINAIDGDDSYHPTGVSASGTTTLHQFKIIWNSNGKADYYIDGNKVYTGTIAFSITSSPLGMGVYDNGEVMWCSSVYCYTTSNPLSGQVTSSNQPASLLTLSRSLITSTNLAQSYGLASVNFLNSSNEVLFTGEPDGEVFAWTATGGMNPLQRQLFSSQHIGKAWHALSAVKTLEPGEGLAGLCVDPTNQNACTVIFWPPQPFLATLPQATSVETAPSAVVVPSLNPLGSNAVVTIRLWDNEGNASTPFLQYQILGATNWQDATLTRLDGAAYSPATQVIALSGGSNHILDWNASGDIGANVITNIWLRARAQDFLLAGNWSQPTPFQLNTTITTNPTNAPVNFTGITAMPGGIVFNWQGSTNALLYLQRSPALAGTNVNWVNIWTGTPPTPITGSYTDSFGTNQMEFYRMKIVSP